MPCTAVQHEKQRRLTPRRFYFVSVFLFVFGGFACVCLNSHRIVCFSHSVSGVCGPMNVGAFWVLFSDGPSHFFWAKPTSGQCSSAQALAHRTILEYLSPAAKAVCSLMVLQLMVSTEVLVGFLSPRRCSRNGHVFVTENPGLTANR